MLREDRPSVTHMLKNLAMAENGISIGAASSLPAITSVAQGANIPITWPGLLAVSRPSPSCDRLSFITCSCLNGSTGKCICCPHSANILTLIAGAVRPKTLEMAAKTAMAALPLAMAIWSRDTLGVCIGLSFAAAVFLDALIPGMSLLLKLAGRTGRDMNKAKRPEIPESLGIAAGAVYISVMFLFIPFPFLSWSAHGDHQVFPLYPFQQVPLGP